LTDDGRQRTMTAYPVSPSALLTSGHSGAKRLL